jgi:hypothetical protein
MNENSRLQAYVLEHLLRVFGETRILIGSQFVDAYKTKAGNKAGQTVTVHQQSGTRNVPLQLFHTLRFLLSLIRQISSRHE